MRQIDIKNILISYAFIKSFSVYDKLCDGFEPQNLILDSGAFSVWSKGDFVDIDAYGKYCQEMIQNVSKNTQVYCVNLDVLPGKFGIRPTQDERIKSAEEGWKNMEYLESTYHIKTIPVFHQHEPFEWLDRIKEHTDYFGVSPANDVSMREKLQWLDKVFSIIKANYRTHGFAVTSSEQLERYPFFSVDSSSWSAGGRFARIPIFVNGRVENMQFKDEESFKKYWDKLPSEYLQILDDYSDRMRIGILTYKLYQDYVTRLWEARGITWKEREIEYAQ